MLIDYLIRRSLIPTSWLDNSDEGSGDDFSSMDSWDVDSWNWDGGDDGSVESTQGKIASTFKVLYIVIIVLSVLGFVLLVILIYYYRKKRARIGQPLNGLVQQPMQHGASFITPLNNAPMYQPPDVHFPPPAYPRP